MIKDTTDEQIKVIYCEVGHKARIAEVDNNLGAFQGLVGGWIEEYIPFDDDVAIVCNEEGKMMGLPLNRAITEYMQQQFKKYAQSRLLLHLWIIRW